MRFAWASWDWQGDSSSADTMYGAHIFINTPIGMPRARYMVDNVEFRQMGQAFRSVLMVCPGLPHNTNNVVVFISNEHKRAKTWKRPHGEVLFWTNLFFECMPKFCFDLFCNRFLDLLLQVGALCDAFPYGWRSSLQKLDQPLFHPPQVTTAFFGMLLENRFKIRLQTCSDIFILFDSYNRATTIHGSHNVTVRGNFAYNVMGHTWFLEDGIETGNVIEGNLGILTRGSDALLVTDTSPATFWVTNPNNTYRFNHAAGKMATIPPPHTPVQIHLFFQTTLLTPFQNYTGSQAYGFWFQFLDNPGGPSFTTSVCPKFTPLGIVQVCYPEIVLFPCSSIGSW